MTNKEIVKNYLDVLDIDYEIKTLEDITKLIKAHLRTLAFSSLKVLLKEEISLDLESIYKNVVVQKRGAYCFEHNKLIYEALKELGFDVEYYLARVINNSSNITPQTHRFTLLTYEGERYLIDAGVGFRTPSVPVKIGGTSISHLGVEYKVLEFEDKTYSMQLMQNGKPFYVTKFDLNRCYEPDFEMGHFYAHKSPVAVFVNNLVISLIHDNVINSLVNSRYLKIYEDETIEVQITSSKHLAQLLKNDFNVMYTFDEVSILFENYIEKTRYLKS